MRKFTNSENMEVEVDESHLQSAAELKLELQKESFGGKCNWVRHKRMMEQSGIFNSDTNEAYRCLIKSYQKETGQLKSVEKYADYVADSKLQAIRNLVGEMKFTKLETREENLVKSRLDRELTFKAMAVQEFRDLCLDDLNITVPHYVYQPRLKDNGNVMMVVLADWHIGAKFKCLNNEYNLEIASKRLDYLINKTIEISKAMGVTTINISLLGDEVENVAMRFTQSADCEFSTARQIVEVRRLVFKFIIAMAEHFNVEVNAVKGNHSRLTPDKTQEYEDDNVTYIIMENLKDMIIMSGIDRVKVNLSDNDYDFQAETINGVNVRKQHGDEDSINDSTKIEKYSGIDVKKYEVLVFGHLHHFDDRQGNGRSRTIYCSSLQGANLYSRNKVKSSSNAGQTLILFTDNGEVYPFNVDLQYA